MASHASAAALGVLVAVGVGLAAREATSTEPPSAAPALQAVDRVGSLPTERIVTGLWARRAGEVFAFGDGVVLRFDGAGWLDTGFPTSWHVAYMYIDGAGRPAAHGEYVRVRVCCVAARYAVPCGYDRAATELAWNDVEWERPRLPPLENPFLSEVHRLDSRALAGFGGLMSVAPSPTFGAGWDLGPDTWTISRDGRALTRWHGMDRETFIGREPPGW